VFRSDLCNIRVTCAGSFARKEELSLTSWLTHLHPHWIAELLWSKECKATLSHNTVSHKAHSNNGTHTHVKGVLKPIVRERFNFAEIVICRETVYLAQVSQYNFFAKTFQRPSLVVYESTKALRILCPTVADDQNIRLVLARRVGWVYAGK
jgi:5-methylthioribose kinase